uniref:Uncharacterized protein n=1 Tax=Schistocephalus solidus TaxID=70667 RepID=A0A0X3NN52_SCHSO
MQELRRGMITNAGWAQSQLHFLGRAQSQLHYLGRAQSQIHYLGRALSQMHFLGKAQSQVPVPRRAESQVPFLWRAQFQVSFLWRAQIQVPFLRNYHPQVNFLSASNQRKLKWFQSNHCTKCRYLCHYLFFEKFQYTRLFGCYSESSIDTIVRFHYISHHCSTDRSRDVHLPLISKI